MDINLVNFVIMFLIIRQSLRILNVEVIIMMKNKLKFTITLMLIFFLCTSLVFTVAAKEAGVSCNPYIKNKTIPEFLYVIEQNNLASSERTMISTLQGITSNSKYQIYTLDAGQPSYKIWLDGLKKNYGIKYKVVKDPWKLVSIFKPYIKGYILYENADSGDPSINNACSLASLKNSIVIDASIEKKVQKAGIKNKIFDCRGTDKYWAYNKLWNSGLNHSCTIELDPTRKSALRDYAIMTKSLVFYEENKNEFTLRNKVFSSMNKNSICLGWGPSEFSNISCASRHGISIVPADWSYNLSVLSSIPSKPISQESDRTFFSYMDRKSLPNKHCHYVTFIMSDGDNQQWNLGRCYSSDKWYGSKYRGKFNMGWSITPSLYYLAPSSFKMYYDSASKYGFKDYFTVSPSGFGYMYPSMFEKSALDLSIKCLNEYMKNADQSYICILDDNALYKKDIWDKYTKQPNIEGIFYLDYKRQDNYAGDIVWSNKKPVVSCRKLLWSGIEDENSLVRDINNFVSEGGTDVHNKDAYTMVYVHAWSQTLKDVYSAASKLSQNPYVKVVPPSIFMESIKQNMPR